MSSDVQHYYVLPVRDMVIFPGIITPLFVGRPRSLKAIEHAMLQERKILLVAQKEVETEDPEAPDLYTVGTVCNILQMVRIPDGTTKVLIEGLERVNIEKIRKGKEVLEADVIPIPKVQVESENIEALKRSALEQFERYVTLHPRIPNEILVSALNMEDAGQIADIIASHITIKVSDKQKLLEISDTEQFLKHLLKVLVEEIEILELEQDIQNRVKKELERGHKEYYLREQLKVIQDELGQGESSSELDELREKIESSGMPEEVHEKALHELDRMSKMPSMSAEATVVRTYIDWLVSLPWQKATVDSLDITRARSVLDKDHYGLEKVKTRILEYLAVRKRASGSEIKGQVLCFVGPPGVGKTSLARSIARSLGRNFVSMSLGGMRDEAEIRGHRKTYIGALPGKIIQKVKQAGTNNPVILMDEIDKMGMDFRGDPSSALLEVLDPEQNSNFTDNFLEVPFDLSQCIFITTANVTHTIPAPLLDRMEIIQIPGYVAEEKKHIARKHLLPKKMKEHGLSKEEIKISSASIELVIKEYTREAGVRQLERQLATICRKAIKSIIESEEKGEDIKYPISVGKKILREYLGPPRSRNVRLPVENQSGFAIGLAWTQTGGDVLVIEAASMKGKGKITLTGNLGDIMQESAQTALGYLKAKSRDLDLNSVPWEETDIHLHVPEGAIPKDGPSAGCTMALAMLSALTGKKVSHQIAMTGEISLRGDILPVGGIREKVLAAKRNNIFHVILPMANKVDVQDMASWTIDKMKFSYVNKVSEVFSLAMK
jgi:ATP-dependent Lon protease